MSRLEIRLLGGFEVWCAGRPIEGFESQKVRALLAYLVMHRETALSRDRLAGLLWPDLDDDRARRNLRQAIYNLRLTLPHAESKAPPILTTHQSVQFNPEAVYWLDVEAFEAAVRQGLSSSGGIDPSHLAGASELYRGDFLTSFYVRDSLDFEHWLLYEQERLREMAIQIHRRLVDYYLACGTYTRGIRYAQRLLEIDPLLEEGHRNLMRLYALSGRRTQALAQYQAYEELLQGELGIEPLEETRALYQAILAGEWPTRAVPGEDELTGPRIPLVGRRKAHMQLRQHAEWVRRGFGRITFVEGESGVGKTRLIETFIREMESQGPVLVLRGQGNKPGPITPYHVITTVLEEGIRERGGQIQHILSALPTRYKARLAEILPGLRAMEPALPRSLVEAPQQMFEATALFLENLRRNPEHGERPVSLVLFLDDLHWADLASLTVIESLTEWLLHRPVWMILAYQPEAIPVDHPLHTLRQQFRRHPQASRLQLPRLEAADIAQIVADIGHEPKAGDLTVYLQQASAGLPLAIREIINDLLDEGILIAVEDDVWGVAGSLQCPVPGNPADLHRLIIHRVRQLPASARRLVTLAAIAGPRFDARLLQEAAGEHEAVVYAGLDVLYERRMIRLVPWQWLEGMPSPAARMPAEQAHVQIYEFAHNEIRFAIYSDVSPERRKIMHGQIAAVLENRLDQGAETGCEVLAYHFAAAGLWDKACAYLWQAAQKAQRTGVPEMAIAFYEQMVAGIDQMLAGAGAAAAQTWWQQREQVLSALAALQEEVPQERQQPAEDTEIKMLSPENSG